MAAQVAGALHALQQQALSRAGRRNMIVGALVCAVGLAVTIATYGHAVHSPGGGVYIVAWGAIAFGAWRFARGLRQRMGPRSS